jgi:pyruvate/oxaloacetate carboxyltransferase
MSHKGNSGKGKKSSKSGAESKSEDVLQAVVGDMAGYLFLQDRRKLTAYYSGPRRLLSR